MTQLTPARLAELVALLEAIRDVKHWTASPREDGTSYVYSPGRGPLRAVVPIAETTTEFGPVIAAIRNEAPALLAIAQAARDAIVMYDRYCLHDYQVDLYDVGKALESLRELLGGVATFRENMPAKAET